MTTHKGKAKAPTEPQADQALKVRAQEGESRFRATARALVEPDFRHGQAASQLSQAQWQGSDAAPGIGDYAEAVGAYTEKAANGDLAFASRMLAAQAVTLDNIFAERPGAWRSIWAIIWARRKPMPASP